MLLGWLVRLVIAVFSRGNRSAEQVKPTLIASRQARLRSERVRRQVGPHVDRSRSLIAAFEAKDDALRGRG